MSKFFQSISLAGLALALPIFALAQTNSVNSVEGGFVVIINIINQYVIPLIIGLAVVYFLWGVLKYVTAGGDEESKGAGRDMMIYGIIALFVMVSVWGLVGVLKGTFNLSEGTPTGTEIPSIPRR